MKEPKALAQIREVAEQAARRAMPDASALATKDELATKQDAPADGERASSQWGAHLERRTPQPPWKQRSY